ncbi:MAG TPA: hypothetical protein DCY18_08580 [Thauera sp.]|nr:hypothetical protein [Thauera sp.]
MTDAWADLAVKGGAAMGWVWSAGLALDSQVLPAWAIAILAMTQGAVGATLLALAAISLWRATR